MVRVRARVQARHAVVIRGWNVVMIRGWNVVVIRDYGYDLRETNQELCQLALESEGRVRRLARARARDLAGTGRRGG